MSRKDDAYNYLSEQILSNRLPPGTPISEMDIAEKLNISRTPVREALRDLVSDGLVITYPSRGSFVSPLTPYDVEEICDLRLLLESWALERGIYSFTDEELDCLEEGFYTAFEETDRAFHRAIVEHSGSKRVADFERILYMQVERIRRINVSIDNRTDSSLKEQLKILNYIRQKNIRCAKAALTEHLCAVAANAIEISKHMKLN